ncbi:hypothetical protein CLV31_10631 [Algoriphagus aquaeductus]|uniref:Uncharacterized protein n=1 Tax=Algoriphagus aquaeductus TaxID=475299 RepID=A0A326RUA9_9BACT|nr:DUF5606 domain-containing protein [Algoriphagus aquaeductus]PZV83418.1 hypothetical protein CLV31_10631 [Algoriphagus aquaeductus]
MNFKDIATVAGKPGLYKILKPTRSGVILESLDEKKAKLVAGMSMRVSILSDISIYTMTEEGAEPLESVMKKIEAEYKGDTGVDASSSDAELRAFLKSVLPEFDQERVYVSDIKKLNAWYQIIRKSIPEVLEESNETEKEA